MNDDEMRNFRYMLNDHILMGAKIQSLYSDMEWMKKIRSQDLIKLDEIPVKDVFFNALDFLMKNMRDNFDFIIEENHDND